MKRTLWFIGILIFLLATTNVWAWWSVTSIVDSTHYKISGDAISKLPAADYPDMQLEWFGRNIKDWTSGPRDDANAHDGTTIPNGGSVTDHWNKALKQYKSFNFNSGDFSAYYYIASMMHLVEDQAVAAHAYNIRHGGQVPMDHMEGMVYWYYDPISLFPADADMTWNYNKMLAYTLNSTASDYWRKYWLPGWPYDVTIGGRPYHFDGVYAGNPIDESDPYTRWDVFPSSWENAGTAERNLSSDLLGQAAAHVAGALMKISQSLPPLVKDLEITPTSDDVPVIERQDGNEISFKILENRTQNVKIFITLDSPDGEPIISAEYGTGKSEDLAGGTALPWEKDYSVVWDGKLANGQYVVGEHTLYVRIEDGDAEYQKANGIESPSAAHPFTTYPVVVSTNPENGSQVSSASTITITFDREMDTASVESAITIDPDFTKTYSWSSDKTITITPSEELSMGRTYTVTVSSYAKDTNGLQLDGDNDGTAGGDYVFSFTIAPNIKIAALTPSYNDGSTYWVKAGTKTVTVQLVDDNGNAILTDTPPQLTWTSPGGATQPVDFTTSGTTALSWRGTIMVMSGSDGQATFTGVSAPASGITSFKIDTRPPDVQESSGGPPSCRCPQGPISVNYTITDAGSGVGAITRVGLGLSVNGCYNPGDYEHGASSIADKVGNTTSRTGSDSISSPPGCDHPDDNYSVNSSLVQSTGNDTQNPEIVVLREGNHAELSLLLDKAHTNGTFADLNGLADALSGPAGLLVIPSAGLYGLENLGMFKAQLEEFVRQGGTLLVFAQQHGYEFSALPVPQEADGTYKTVSGYGWTEDQSCQVNSSFIDTYHQILSGQTRSTPSLNVDGYFTSYPSVATVVLRRTVNGQPSLIMYPYGSGYVIATAMYSDFAYGYGQASSEEIALVRDMISWAKEPAELPEVRAGDSMSVSIPVTVKNDTTTDAAWAKFVLYTPDRSLSLNERTVSLSVPAGQSAAVPLTYTLSASAPLGIYHVDYVLLDA